MDGVENGIRYAFAERADKGWHAALRLKELGIDGVNCQWLSEAQLRSLIFFPTSMLRFAADPEIQKHSCNARLAVHQSPHLPPSRVHYELPSRIRF
jgi:hypothetical protein